MFALPTDHALIWRRAAWVVSALVFAAHVLRERIRFPGGIVPGAAHVAVASAIGAFGLALAANLHSQLIESTSQQQRWLLLALPTWPLLTGVPAFVVALVCHAILSLVGLGRRVKT